MHRVELNINGRVLSLETGLVARQASGGVMVRYGDTFYPVRFVEKLPASGRIFSL
jgi:polyribonucleotide nucleotidyltransferase